MPDSDSERASRDSHLKRFCDHTTIVHVFTEDGDGRFTMRFCMLHPYCSRASPLCPSPTVCLLIGRGPTETELEASPAGHHFCMVLAAGFATCVMEFLCVAPRCFKPAKHGPADASWGPARASCRCFGALLRAMARAAGVSVWTFTPRSAAELWCCSAVKASCVAAADEEEEEAAEASGIGGGEQPLQGSDAEDEVLQRYTGALETFFSRLLRVESFFISNLAVRDLSCH